MSTEQSPNSNLDFLDEELVAYLDGELDSQATKRLEDLLATDEPARKRLSQLANSWELLDQLPRATVDDLFTRTTVEMVALAEEDEVAKHEAGAPARRRMRWLVGGVAALCAAAVGFVAMALAVPDQNDPLLADLPVIYNLELYEPVASIDFLHQLQAAGLFVKDSGEPATNASGQASHPTSVAALQLSIPDSIAKRRDWVEALPPEEKLELRHNLRLFLELSPKEQEALRQFDRQLRADPNVDDLAGMTDRFYDWWVTLGSDDRLQWDDETKLENRIALVHQFQKNQEQAVFDAISRQRPPFALKDPDDLVLIGWMNRHSFDHRLELNPDGPKGDIARPGRGQNGQRLMRAYALWWSPKHPDEPTVRDDELRRLLEPPSPGRPSLSKEKQDALEKAIEQRRTEAVKLIRGWIQTAYRDVVVQAQSWQGALGRGRRGFDFQRGGGPRPFVDGPPREPPAQPDRKEAPAPPKE
jgi:hypothetical protein